MLSERDTPERKESDPPWFDRHDQDVKLESVEILLVHGLWPDEDDQLWKIPGLKVVLRITERKRRGNKVNKLGPPDGWTESDPYSLCHSVLGGVTDAVFQVQTRVLKGEVVEALTPPRVSGVLSEALDSSISGKQTQKPVEGQANTSKGILEWSERTRPIVADFHKTPNHGVKRRISIRELARVMDFPVSRTKQMTEHELKLLTTNDIPGKVVQAAIFFLSQWKSSEDQGRVDKRELVEVDDVSPPKRQKKNEEVINDSEDIVLWIKENADEPQVEMEDHLAEGIPVESMNVEKATKSDDAGVPVHLWDDRVMEKLEEHWRLTDRKEPPNLRSEDGQIKLKRILGWLRMLGLRRWKKNLRLDFFRWYASEGRHHNESADIKRAGKAALVKANQASWWEWDKGSALFFWRWPEHYQDIARKRAHTDVR